MHWDSIKLLGNNRVGPGCRAKWGRVGKGSGRVGPSWDSVKIDSKTTNFFSTKALGFYYFSSETTE